MLRTTVQPKVATITSRSLDSNIVTTANVANVRSEIFSITAKIGQYLLIPNKTKVKGVTLRGYAFIADLRDAANAKIPASELFIAVQTPSDEAEQVVRRLSTSIWGDLDTTQQRSDDYKGGIAQSVDLNRDKPIILEPDHKLIVLLKSSVVVDWSKSYLELVMGEINQ